MKEKIIKKDLIVFVLSLIVLLGACFYLVYDRLNADFVLSCPVSSIFSSKSTKVSLILVNIDKNGYGQLQALDESGNVLTVKQAVLGKFTTDKKNNPSSFNNFATPPGIYSIGKTWDSSKTPQLLSIKDKIGPYFIELQGKPFNGGVPVCGLNNSTCRHVGIHSSSTSNAKVNTKGCVKIDPSTVDYLRQNAKPGTPVLIAENPLFGAVVQSKAGQKIVNYNVAVKKGKKSVPVFHPKNSPYWIAKETSPSGTYTIEISAKGYKKAVLTKIAGTSASSNVNSGQWWLESMLGSQGNVIMLEKQV